MFLFKRKAEPNFYGISPYLRLLTILMFHMKEHTARFDTKMSVQHKSLIEEAARLKGFKSLSDYVVTTMVEDAMAAVSDYKDALYSVEDRKRIMSILSAPTELSSSFLKASQRRSNKMLKDGPDGTV